MPVEFFFKNCNSDPNLRFSTNINFAYNYSKKLSVLKGIINYFEKDILRYENIRYNFFSRLKQDQLSRLYKKAHI